MNSGRTPRFAGRPTNTPATAAIEMHYANLQLVKRWDWHRFSRMCVFLNLTVDEMAALVQFPRSFLAKYKETGRMPMNPEHSKSVALIMTILERYIYEGLVADVIEKPFPNLNLPDK